ncbi:phosphoinositide 3-kinase regulatory subunit [Nesidiocoris tenuis]|uniref:non-specific serine/threonine protein kinase n=1 Tax=Nesidiocoris tenuis TaxID=355587 RepID=A0ABN7AFN1_9HEMI|nr:phosphoinositide 3-kinase regulatory subunit [Nesidiocoris tenuis]
MGNQLVGIAPSQIFPVEHYLTEHSDLHFDINLGSTRFFKVARAKSQEGHIVVKVFAIHDPSLPLSLHKVRIERIRSELSNAVNCLPFQRAILSDKAGFLMREYVKYSLYDRISTRPFLSPIEKKWIAFQILYALYRCHKVGVCHGDIKLENIVITSWHWVLLTDFASYKPTLLPEDNPADFSYFFDTSRRRTCYIAPERFVKTLGPDVSNQLPFTEEKREDLTAAMDIFSAGCALAELYTDGQPPFDFSQLLSYRSGEYSPENHLSRIEDDQVRILIRDMIQRDPQARMSAEFYLDQQRGKLFPEYFYTFLHSYMLIYCDTNPILSPDEKIERLKKDVRNIIQLLTKEENNYCQKDEKNGNVPSGTDALVLITSLVTSCIRGLHFSNSKIQCLEILAELAVHTTSETVLDRILPYIMYLINDPFPRVRVYAVHTLRKALSYVKVVPPSDANVFPEYILPGLSQVAHDDSVIVRTAFAENIAELAEISLRLLEHWQVSHSEAPRHSYESELATLHQMMQQMVSALLTDHQNIVKQTLIENGITKLCVFFGKQKANDVLLSHMITFLNDKDDKQLRGSFFDCIVGVAAFIGVHSSPILSPLLQQGLTDTEEFVIRKAINAITALTELSLLHKSSLYQLLGESAQFLAHPNLWIRQAVVGFISALARTLNIVDVQCKVMPMIEPYLKHNVIQLEKEIMVLNALKSPVPRSVYDTVVKCSEVNLLLQTLADRQSSRKTQATHVSLPSAMPASPQQNSALRNLFRRLTSDGMNEDVEEMLVLMSKLLVKTNRYIVQETKTQPSGKLELNNLKFPVHTHSATLSKASDAIKGEVNSFPVNRRVGEELGQMNDEWKHMFGTVDYSNPVAPPVSMKDKVTPPPSSNQQSLDIDYSMQERSYIQCRCAPCRQELRELIKHRERLYRALLKGKEWTERGYRPPLSPPGWRLRPALVSHLHDHSAPVTRLVSFPDKTIMASCSHDGCVGIWDCGKMEGRNIANKAKQLYNAHSGPLLGMTLCNNNAFLGTVSQTGSVVVLRIDNGSSKMSAFDSRQLSLEDEGAPVDIAHLDSGSQSVLVYSTIFGCLIGWDLRSPGIAWKLDNDIKHGVVTAMHMDSNQYCLSIGTNNGYLTSWDLRFHLPIGTIIHPNGSRIRRLCSHPTQPSWLISAIEGNNEVSLYCIESGSRQTVLWGSGAPPLSNSQSNTHSICGMYSGIVDKVPFLLTGGTDHRIRYWDLDNLGNSYLAIPAGGDVPGQINFSYKCRLIDGTNVVQEIQTKCRQKSSNLEEAPRAGPDQPAIGHHNAITDITMCQGSSQYFMVSAARDGVIKVWK